MITIIAAVGENNELGKGNDMIWHLPNDFKRFKELTSNNFILMGRKTFESLPGILPNRTHLIISSNIDYKVSEKCFLFKSIEDGLKDKENVFIIGGGEIYKQSIKLANKLEITKVHGTFDADTFFPEIGDEWYLKSSVFHPKDERHKYDFTYLTYVRK